MKAVLCDALNGFEHLIVRDVPEPVLGQGDGDVLINVKAAGLNFADTLITRGKYQVKPPLPFSPGLEISGEVVAVADHVTRAKVGQRVMAILPYGGFAEQVLASEDTVYPISDNMDWASAAGFPIAYGTSYVGLMNRANLKSGETVLIHGAAGGVGITAVEVAKQCDARVIATAGGAEKLQIAKDHGADDLIDYRTEDVRARVKELTGGVGVDVVYDPVGGDLFDISLRVIKPGGRILVVGFASGDVPQIPANILLVKNVDIIGFYFGGMRAYAPEIIQQGMSELMALFEAGKITPHVSHTFPLDAAVDALATLQERRSTGKVVLTV